MRPVPISIDLQGFPLLTKEGARGRLFQRRQPLPGPLLRKERGPEGDHTPFNLDRFPPDFMLQLSDAEFENLRSQFATSSQWGGHRYPPYAFTEQGVAMLSSVLRSKRAVQVKGLRPAPSPARLTRRFGAEARRVGATV
jgi:hypothetical protein